MDRLINALKSNVNDEGCLVLSAKKTEIVLNHLEELNKLDKEMHAAFGEFKDLNPFKDITNPRVED